MLLIPGALVLPLLQPFDQQWTVWLHEHGSKEFGLWMGRTMFEGKLPGASDPARRGWKNQGFRELNPSRTVLRNQ